MKKACPLNIVSNFIAIRQKPLQNPIKDNNNINIPIKQNIIDLLPQIIEKIHNNQQITQSDKHTIIDIMSIKYHCSFRKNLLVDSMNIQKCNNGIHLIDKISSHKSGKSYFVLKGKLQIYGNLYLNKNVKSRLKNEVKNKFNIGMNYNNLNQSNNGISNYLETMSQNPFEDNLRESTKSIPKEDNVNYHSMESFIKDNEDVVLIDTVQELRGYGSLFNTKETSQSTIKNLILVGQDSIIIQIKNAEQILPFNNGGMEQKQKIELLDKFPIFNCLRKKLSSYLQYFELKQYTYNQIIYRQNDTPTHFYLIMNGQISFHSKITLNNNISNKIIFKLKSNVISQVDQSKRSSRGSINKGQIPIQTQTLSIGSYFGQQQIINECKRNLTCKCASSSCFLLQIGIDKFKKLLEYNDFYQTIKKAAYLRIMQRQQSLKMANKIHNKFYQNSNQQQSDETHFFNQAQKDVIFNRNHFSNPMTNRQNNQNVIANPKSNKSKMKIMHGVNVTSVENKTQTLQQIQFSMLRANQQIYQSTLKKFRRFTIKPKPKVKPQVNWDLKRVWKVLNLENILRDDVDIGEPEGLKYYEIHRKYLNHINELKSIRPKTTSSTYRTKLQYIAYLQQFNSPSLISQFH